MRNVLTTPEGREFVFIIPEGAKLDKEGFYIIDDGFKAVNGHLNFDYLEHDLRYRGLHYNETFYDAKDRLENKISHGDYYMQFINLREIEPALIRSFGKERLMSASVDNHLNEIPLSEWDIFNARPFVNKKKWRWANSAAYRLQDWGKFIWSPSCNVCVAKTAATALIAKWKM